MKAITFNEALKVLKNGKKTKSIKLINGEIVEGSIIDVYEDMIVIQKNAQLVSGAMHTIQIKSILYISDCDLT